MNKELLTKTLFTYFVRCPKLFWLSTHNKDLATEDSLGVQFRKKQGVEVGNLAKGLYPEGMDLAKLSDVAKLELTEMHKDKVLFEASVQYENLFARADILIPHEDGSFDIIEVKSDAELKKEHIPDVAFQKYVFEKAGFKIRNVFLMHTNNEYVKQGELELNKLFFKEDVLQFVDEYGHDMAEKISLALEVMEKTEEQAGIITRACLKPYECSFKSYCWQHLPKNNVMKLYYDKNLGFKLLDEGIELIKDMPDNIELKGRGKSQRAIQIQMTKEDNTHFNKVEMKKFVDALNYPIYHFDFETYAPAIPIFDNSRPWQQVPFQFSLHIEQEDGTFEHHEFLSTTNEDPRPALMQKMKECLGTSGDILVYNKRFEKMIIEQLARDFPDFQEDAINYLSRLVDLAEPFEKFHFYHPEQEGRYSIKSILPILTDLSYKEMEVGNGEEAFITYKRIAFMNDPNREELIEHLKAYCELDTFAELKILQKIKFMLE